MKAGGDAQRGARLAARESVLTITAKATLLALLAVGLQTTAAAQDNGKGGDANAGTAPAAAGQDEADPDLDLNPAQPDFTLVNLPTALRVPRHKSSFRVTHRFARPLGSGSFGDLIQDAFGLDGGAQIGLEYRFGLFRGTQIGIHRTSDRTIEFFLQHDLVQQTENRSSGLALVLSVEGVNNFRDEYSPAVGVNWSRTFGETGALYLVPMWVHNTNLFDIDPEADDATLLLGVGGRFRWRPTVYLVAEYAPRVIGYDVRVNQGSFSIEKRAGGHVFQLNFSNGLGTTWGQIARGGTANTDWYIGFNISRKFF